MKNIFTGLFLILSCVAISQNVAINSTGAAPAASAMLDIASTTSGLLIPRMTTAQRIAIAAPATGLKVYDTTTGSFWYFNGTIWVQQLNTSNGWSLSGNNLIGTEFMGSTNSQPVRFFSNNLERMRINPTDGEVVVGAATSGLPGDMLCAVSNNLLPWAVNGYSGLNGSGVYGQITSGTTVFGAVQGEYNGTSNMGCGVRGSYLATGGGIGFTQANCRKGVNGIVTSAGSYKIGVYGYGGSSARSGGVIGNDFDLAFGGLGYLSSGFIDYSVYGFGVAFNTGVIGGKLSSNSMNKNIQLTESNKHIGIGIYGGVMGGWVKGLVYGTNLSGPKYGVYVDGKAISNESFIQLNTLNDNENRLVTYATTAKEKEIILKGKGKTVAGKAVITIDEQSLKLIGENIQNIIISITPYGQSNGFFVSNVGNKGFEITENNNGNRNVDFSWLAIATINNSDEKVSEEITKKEFDLNMNGVMHNENAPTKAKSIWWDGSNVRFSELNENRIVPIDVMETIRKK